MTDIADDAQAAEAQYREAAIAAARSAPGGGQIVEGGRVVCADCGEPIPTARLAAVPGATRCRDCQATREK